MSRYGGGGGGRGGRGGGGGGDALIAVPLSPAKSGGTTNLLATTTTATTTTTTTTMSDDAAPSRRAQAIAVGAYFLLNLTLTLQNKAVLSTLAFQYPWTMTAMHQAACAVGAYIAIYALRLAPPMRTLRRSEQLQLAAFSVLYTVNIAMSNVSLNLVTLSFHQTFRSLIPVFTTAFNYAVFGRQSTAAVAAALLPVVLGVMLATFGEYGFTAVGAVLTLLGVVLSTTKGVFTNVLLVGELRLHPFDLLARMAPLACAQSLAFAYVSGESADVARFFAELPSDDALRRAVLVLASNSALAFVLSFASFNANKKTGALTMSVCGNLKQALSISLGVWLFDVVITPLNAAGIIITILGGFCYTYAKFRA